MWVGSRKDVHRRLRIGLRLGYYWGLSLAAYWAAVMDAIDEDFKWGSG